MSGQAQLFYFLQRSQELLLVMVVVRKFDNVLLVLAYQPGRQNQEVGANSVQSGREVLRRQTESFEPMNDIGGKQQDLKESNVGCPRIGRYFAQGIIVEEFADVFLYRGSWIVKQIDPPRADFEVGDKEVVDILFVLEQSQLLGFCRVFWSGTAQYHKAMELAPFVVDFLPELAHLPAVLKSLKFAAPSPLLEVRELLGHHHIAAPAVVEKSNHAAAVKARIHPKTDATSGNRLGYLGQADFQEGHSSCRSHGISRSQRTVPELLEVSLEAEQGMVGTSASFFGVVANSCSLGSAIDDNNDRVQVEDQSASCVGKAEQVGPQAVVQPGQLADRFDRQALQESPQGRLIGKTPEPQHLQKGPVVLQDLGLVDSAQPHDDGKHQSHDHLGRIVKSTSVWNPHVFLNQPAQSQLVAKTLNQPHPTKVSDVGLVEGKTDFSRTFWHMA